MPRLAFPVYFIATFAPVVGCTVVSALAIAGIVAPVPAVIIAVSLLSVTIFGTLITKWLEEWESRPRPNNANIPQSERAS